MDLTFLDLFRVLAIPLLCHLTSCGALQSSSTSASPIEIKSIEVTPSSAGCNNVTLTFTAMSEVQVVWTIDEGVQPEKLNPNTIVHNHLITTGDSHTCVCLPTDLVYDKLMLHLSCPMHLFELHLDMRIPKHINNVREVVEQYSLLVPSANEIGVTSRGEARFPVMVNTSNTAYTFGLLQAEVTMLHGNSIQHESAYSFLPVNKHQVINVNKIATDGRESHFNVAIKSDILPKGEALLVIMAACSNPNSIIDRLDIKQEVLMPKRRGIYAKFVDSHVINGEPGFHNSLNFINGEPETITVSKGKHATIVCKTVGVKDPKTALYKRTVLGAESVTVPYYTMSLPYEMTTVFQLLNVTAANSGDYICKATKNELSASKLFTVNVLPS